MTLEYDGTREDFAANLRAILPALQVGSGKRAQLREAGLAIYEASDWTIVRMTGLDRLFLSWLVSPLEPWLETPPSVDFWLPQSAMLNPAYGTAELKARDARVKRCALALGEWGWPEDEAIIFVCSKEEWADAQPKVATRGRVAA